MREGLPEALIIGAGRSGTTALASLLARHPDVAVTSPKEPHFWAFPDGPPGFVGPGDDEWINRVVPADLGAYARCVPDSRPGLVRIDASVSTMYYGNRSSAHIERKYGGRPPRLVAILRDPADRAFSAHQFLRMRGLEPIADFRDALRAEAGRVDAGWHHLWHYRGMGHYADQLRPFVDRFGRDRLLVVFHDDLAADQRATLRRVADHLGIRGPVGEGVDPTPYNVSGSADGSVLRRTAMAAIQFPPVRVVGRWLLTPSARSRLRGRIVQQSELTPADRVWLRTAFADADSRLADLLGVELPWR